MYRILTIVGALFLYIFLHAMLCDEKAEKTTLGSHLFTSGYWGTMLALIIYCW